MIPFVLAAMGGMAALIRSVDEVATAMVEQEKEKFQRDFMRMFPEGGVRTPAAPPPELYISKEEVARAAAGDMAAQMKARLRYELMKDEFPDPRRKKRR